MPLPEIAGDTELLIGPAPEGVPDEGCPILATDSGGDKDEELDRAVGEMSGDVLILIWMLLFGVPGVVVDMDVGKKRAAGEVRSRGSRSMSHFRLQRKMRQRQSINTP